MDFRKIYDQHEHEFHVIPEVRTAEHRIDAVIEKVKELDKQLADELDAEVWYLARAYSVMGFNAGLEQMRKYTHARQQK